MTLVDAIRDALNFVDEHKHEMTRQEVKKFKNKATAVYFAARQLGIADAIPQIAELAPQLEMAGEAALPVQYESELNLPGDWYSEPISDQTPEPKFLVCDSPRWRDTMSRLRQLAVEVESEPPMPSLEVSEPTQATPTAAIDETKLPTISENECLILQCLYSDPPVLRIQTTIEADTLIARKTVGKSLKRLRELGLVYRPQGVRGGEALTDKGRALVERLSPQTIAPYAPIAPPIG